MREGFELVVGETSPLRSKPLPEGKMNVNAFHEEAGRSQGVPMGTYFYKI